MYICQDQGIVDNYSTYIYFLLTLCMDREKLIGSYPFAVETEKL